MIEQWNRLVLTATYRIYNEINWPRGRMRKSADTYGDPHLHFPVYFAQ